MSALKLLTTFYSGEIGMDSMYVRDAARPRIFLAPNCFWEQQNILHVAGQIPILMQRDLVATPGSPVLSVKSVKTTSDKVEKVDQKDKIPGLQMPSSFSASTITQGLWVRIQVYTTTSSVSIKYLLPFYIA